MGAGVIAFNGSLFFFSEGTTHAPGVGIRDEGRPRRLKSGRARSGHKLGPR